MEEHKFQGLIIRISNLSLSHYKGGVSWFGPRGFLVALVLENLCLPGWSWLIDAFAKVRARECVAR